MTGHDDHAAQAGIYMGGTIGGDKPVVYFDPHGAVAALEAKEEMRAALALLGLPEGQGYEERILALQGALAEGDPDLREYLDEVGIAGAISRDNPRLNHVLRTDVPD